MTRGDEKSFEMRRWCQVAAAAALLLGTSAPAAAASPSERDCEIYAANPSNSAAGTACRNYLKSMKPGVPFFKGGEGTYAGIRAMNRVIASKPREQLTADEKKVVERKKKWDENGNVALSCQEFVHEKYYNYSKLTDGFGFDARRNFELLLKSRQDSGNVLAGDVLSREGQAVQALSWPKEAGAKNEFFAFTPGPYPDGTEAYQFDDGLLEQLDAGRKFAVRDLGYHLDMAERLAGQPDAVFHGYSAKRAAFRALLARRSARFARFERDSKNAKDKQEQQQIAEIAGKDLYLLDAEIAKSLQEAEQNGCLKLDERICDWAPEDLVNAVDLQIAPNQSRDYLRCLRQFPTGNLDELLRRYGLLEILPSLIDGKVLVPFDLPMGVPDVPLSESERAALQRKEIDGTWTGGSDYINGTVGYHAGFGIESGPYSTRFCDSELWSEGRLDAGINLFDIHQDLFSSVIRAQTERVDMVLTFRLRLFGNDILYSQRYANSFSLANDLESRSEWGSRPEREFRWWITFNVAAVGTFGIDYELSGGVNRTCTAEQMSVGFLGTLTPHLDVDLFLDGRAEPGGPAMGVEIHGQLKLIGGSAPVSADLALVSPSDDLSEVYMHAGLNADLDMTVMQVPRRVVFHYWDFSFSSDIEVIPAGAVFLGTEPLIHEDYNVLLRNLFP